MTGPDAHREAVRVSVIVPVFNAEKTLQKAIESVLQQTFPAVELIVVDDCSTDASAAMVEAYADKDPRVKAIRQPSNAGVAAARNRGLDAASGTHIAFLDSDDWWAPRKLEMQLEQMRRSAAKVCYATYQRVDETGKAISLVRPPSAITYTDLLKSNYIGHLTGLYERSVGNFRFRRIGHEDYAFWLDVLKASGGAVCASHRDPLAFYTVRSGSISSNKLRAAGWQWRIYRDVVNLGIFNASRYMIHYAIRAVMKRRPEISQAQSNDGE
jgi:teichuronic acid biosynthesis glycosyltransferase TuaG